MSRDWRVGFARVMDRCDGPLAERKVRRRIRRRTGSGPSAPVPREYLHPRRLRRTPTNHEQENRRA